MKYTILPAIVLCLVIACSPKQEQQTQVSLDSLFKSFHEERLRLFPLLATSMGDNRYNDIFPNNITQEYRQQVKDFYQRYKDQLAAHDPIWING
jgi:hypothetical protein